MLNSTVLIVDDESSYLELAEGLLKQEGYQNVLTKSNPLEVIPLLEKQNVDVILLDIYMPEMNGLDLLESIYAQFPRIPVIIVTAVNEVDLALKAPSMRLIRPGVLKPYAMINNAMVNVTMTG